MLKSISQQLRKKIQHDKIVLSAKATLDSIDHIEILIHKDLIYSNISHKEPVIIKNVRKKYYDAKEEIKSFKTYTVPQSFCNVKKIQKVKTEGMKRQKTKE